MSKKKRPRKGRFDPSKVSMPVSPEEAGADVGPGFFSSVGGGLPPITAAPAAWMQGLSPETRAIIEEQARAYERLTREIDRRYEANDFAGAAGPKRLRGVPIETLEQEAQRLEEWLEDTVGEVHVSEEDTRAVEAELATGEEETEAPSTEGELARLYADWIGAGETSYDRFQPDPWAGQPRAGKEAYTTPGGTLAYRDVMLPADPTAPTTREGVFAQIARGILAHGIAQAGAEAATPEATPAIASVWAAPDETILAAARDAYERAVALRERYARPRAPYYVRRKLGLTKEQIEERTRRPPAPNPRRATLYVALTRTAPERAWFVVGRGTDPHNLRLDAQDFIGRPPFATTVHALEFTNLVVVTLDEARRSYGITDRELREFAKRKRWQSEDVPNPAAYEVWLSRPGAGFAPRAWTDSPLEAVLVSTISGIGDLANARAFAQAFNEAELVSPKGAWALILAAGVGARPGILVRPRPANVDPRAQ